ncbi:hypothetical protein LIA77_08354 [Sarocladium implicatum]|nr:hypothetical protein LIA77_08354 [Sarocladium implicatum]
MLLRIRDVRQLESPFRLIKLALDPRHIVGPLVVGENIVFLGTFESGRAWPIEVQTRNQCLVFSTDGMSLLGLSLCLYRGEVYLRLLALSFLLWGLWNFLKFISRAQAA